MVGKVGENMVCDIVVIDLGFSFLIYIVWF